VVHTHAFGSAVEVEYGASVSKVGDVAGAFIGLSADEGETAGGAGIASSHQFQLIVSFSHHPRNHGLHVALIFVQFLLEDLSEERSTLGTTLEQYSETWEPP
jgi:hypothetical protein